MASSESFFCAIKWILSKDFENRRWDKKWGNSWPAFFFWYEFNVPILTEYVAQTNEQKVGDLSAKGHLVFGLYWVYSWNYQLSYIDSGKLLQGTIQGEYCIFTFSSNATWWNSVSVESKLHKAIDTRHDTWNMKERIMYEKTTELST